MPTPSTNVSQGFDLGQIIQAGAQVGTAYIQAEAAKSAAKRITPGGNTVAILAGVLVVGVLGFMLLRRK